MTCIKGASSELWQACYQNVLSTLKREADSVEYYKRVQIMWKQLTPVDKNVQKAVIYQNAYEECIPTVPYKKGRTYVNIIQKYLSAELRFITNDRYVISNNEYISQVLWIKVWAIQQKYSQLDLAKNLKNKVNSEQFKYVGLIKSITKNI